MIFKRLLFARVLRNISLLLGSFIVVAACLALPFIISERLSESRLRKLERSTKVSNQFRMLADADDLSIEWSQKPLDHLSCIPGASKFVEVQISNLGSKVVYSSLKPAKTNFPVNIGYFFTNTNGERIHQLNPHSTFHPPLNFSGEGQQNTKRKVKVRVQCPKVVGRYDLTITTVQESVGWQPDFGSKRQWIDAKVRVLKHSQYVAANNFIRHVKLPQSRGTARVILDEAFKISYATVASSLRVQRWKGRSFVVSEAGSAYPAIWVRDMATIQRSFPMLLHKSARQNIWIDLFLESFSDRTGIADWIAFDFGIKKTGKNTITSDQELWLLVAVAEAIEMGLVSKDWLQDDIGPFRRSGYLVRVLDWVFRQYWHRSGGCLVSGHTADWGDVGLAGHDNASSTTKNSKSYSVCSLYLNSLLYYALTKLSKFIPDIDSETIQALGGFLAIKRGVKNFTQTLWQPEKGFF